MDAKFEDKQLVNYKLGIVLISAFGPPVELEFNTVEEFHALNAYWKARTQ